MREMLDMAQSIIAQAWRLLPSKKCEAAITRIVLTDLGMVHGQYEPDTGILRLNPSIFDLRQRIDEQGNEHPIRRPWATRALHTTIHEIAHAMGEGTELDRTREWLALSGWVKDREDASGYGRYLETRPGWDFGYSDWRYKHGSFFTRPYSSKSPYEQFADDVTCVALGWMHVFMGAGKPQLAYILRRVWGRSITMPRAMRVVM